MNLRAWKYEDILRISEMEKECFPDEPWSYRALVSSFAGDNFYGVVAEEDGEIIGYGGMTFAGDDADIDNVAVSEVYRGGGVGGEIIENLLAEGKARGVKRVFLEVRVSNSTAMGLYLRHGFKGMYARTRYYSNGEDCLVMVKEL